MPNLNGDKPETVIIASQSALYQPVMSVSKDGEKLNKDRVSFKYSSKFLLNIGKKCDFSLPNNLVFSAPKNPKNFNFCKLSQNKFGFTDHKPQFPSNNTKKGENKPQLKQKRNFNSPACSKKNSPPSLKCTAVNHFSKNTYTCKNASQTLSNSNKQCSISKPKSNEKSHVLYCNAKDKPKTEGGGAGQEKSLLPFQGRKNTEVIKTSGGGKGKASEPTSDMDSFCLGTVTHVDSLNGGESNTPINSCPKPKKVCVVCENCQNPILGLINDHTYSKEGFGKIFQHYKFMKTDSKSDLGKLKIFSLNVGGLKSKLTSDELEKEILNYDIVCLSEVKMDLVDLGVLKTDFDQFTIFSNIKDEYNFKPRGE